MTKADFNQVDDKFLYLRGKPWEITENIVGKLWVNIPYIGLLATVMSEIIVYRSIITFLLVAFTLIGFRVA